MSFSLHPKLAEDTSALMELELCTVRLMEHAVFPWVILVPRRDGVRELHELGAEDYALCCSEIRRASLALQKMTGADKMNIAALGNVVPQMHIHVIGRFLCDAAWPQPVWNSGVAPVRYESVARERFTSDFQTIFSAF